MLCGLVLAENALGVDPQQHVHAVAGPLGDLGSCDAGVEPGGHCGVPQSWGVRRAGSGPVHSTIVVGRAATADAGVLAG